MIRIANPADCCGCTACASICENEAIIMKPDAMGFLYPEVDLKNCIDCGLCEEVCAFNDNYDTALNLEKPIVYGARHKNIDEVMKSQSGAAFYAIYDYALSQQGGVVYGVEFNEHFRVAHKRAITKRDCEGFRGSKYVQSDLTGIFHQVRADLNDDKTVLFSGTGCQTAALNSFVGPKLRKNLILVDIVCHGVLGPFLWRDYVDLLEKKRGKKLEKVIFRDKVRFGWSAHRDTFVFSDGSIECPDKKFYSGTMLRYSCMNCHFCNLKRPSDITIGDFWGLEKQGSEDFVDNKGVSLILVNTEKGKELWGKIKNDMNCFVAGSDAYLQPNLQHPTELHPKRKQFEMDYIKKGVEYVLNHDYNMPPLSKRISILMKIAVDKLKH